VPRGLIASAPRPRREGRPPRPSRALTSYWPMAPHGTAEVTLDVRSRAKVVHWIGVMAGHWQRHRASHLAVTWKSGRAGYAILSANRCSSWCNAGYGVVSPIPSQSSISRPRDAVVHILVLRRFPLVTRALRFVVRSPWLATPRIRFLFIGPQLRSTLPPHGQSPLRSRASLRSP
jgi:hypothetical protein